MASDFTPDPIDETTIEQVKIHEFYMFMRDSELPKILRGFIQRMQTSKSTEFPISDYGLSCYMQAMTDIFECLARLEWNLDIEATGTERRKEVIQSSLDMFKVMKEAWLMMKFQVPGGN